MNLQTTLERYIKEAIKVLFETEVEALEFQKTRPEFNGDITLVTFPLARALRKSPQTIAESIGDYLNTQVNSVSAYNVIKGFLNIEISDCYYIDLLYSILKEDRYGFVSCNPKEKVTMVEYASPNTNKPLHLGHIRNILLGDSISRILEANGKRVYKTQIINDRGIHICKSMCAWQLFAGGETPEKAQIKGDQLVGKYYVIFDQKYKAEIKELMERGVTEEEAKKSAPILKQAQNLLRKWEAGDRATQALWKKMNAWVYQGFDVTYRNLNVDFDCLYYESKTYLLGKEYVDEGVKKGIFYRAEDGSIWCDLTEEGLDQKLVLRSDGTALYITQDIGTAIQRVKDYPEVGGVVYTVGNEQDYHFKVLFHILKKFGFNWADQLFHLSYGMVDLPDGKMKSREGNVVDADDLIEEMTKTAREVADELGKINSLSDAEKKELYSTIGLAAMKYHILKVDPKKRILFNPKKSIDFQGNTGPFIQYAYARISAILRKVDFDFSDSKRVNDHYKLEEKERTLIKQLEQFPSVLNEAASQLSPSRVANYVYDLVKAFNSFYQNTSILGAQTKAQRLFRVQLSKAVSQTIKNAFSLLGIGVPDRM